MFNRMTLALAASSLGLAWGCGGGCRGGSPGYAQGPFFQQMVQIQDFRGALHVVAVDSDRGVWHFREPGVDRQWLVEPLGGAAEATPSAAYSAGGMLQVWAVHADRSLWANFQKPDASGWSGWTLFASPPALEVSAALMGDGRTAVAILGTDGNLQIAWQDPPNPLSHWTVLGPASAGPPILIRSPDQGLEVVWADGQKNLRGATFAKGSIAPLSEALPGPKLGGPLMATGSPSGVVLVAAAAGGGTASWQRTPSGWRAFPLLAAPPEALGAFQLAVPDGKSVLAVASGSEGGTWWSTLTAGTWSPWTNSHLEPAGKEPAMDVGLQRLTLDTGRLNAIAQHGAGGSGDPSTLKRPRRLGFDIHIDQVTPDPSVGGDPVSFTYTLWNDTPDAGVGQVTATWDGAQMTPVPPAFSPPLGAGDRFHGAFTLAPGSAQPGTHQIHLQYAAGFSRVIDTSTGPVTLSFNTQYAEDNLTLQTSSLTDSFPTDDPPVTAGPWTCLATSPDNQHACGQGLCSGGNTPFTCPVDCPTPRTNVVSYNSQDACRGISGFVQPMSINEARDDLRLAADAGARLRVVANMHTSNAQLCTDGEVLSTVNLLGAAPPLPRAPRAPPDFCSHFDCGAALGDGGSIDPVLETYQGVPVVRVGPGKNLFDLENWLDQQGLSLGYAIPAFRLPTVGGAIATGTHGSSPTHSSVISSRVRWLLMVMPNGEVHEFDDSSPADMWRAVRTSLGYLGVVTQIRLEVSPSFNLRAASHWVGIKDLLGKNGPQAEVAGCDFGEMIWFPDEGSDDGQVMVICENETQDQADPNAEITHNNPEGSDDGSKAYPAVDLMQSEACSDTPLCDMETLRYTTMRYYQPPFSGSDCSDGVIKVALVTPDSIFESQAYGLSKAEAGALAGGGITVLDPLLNFLTGGVLDSVGGLPALLGAAGLHYGAVPDCNANLVGKWHRMMSSALTQQAYRPFERDWEIFIPGQNAKQALAMAKQYFAENKLCLPLIGVFLRFAPPEDTTLIAHTVNQGPFGVSSPGMFFEMPVFLPKGIRCSDQERYEAPYAELARRLVSDPINGRGHWAKNRRSLFQWERQVGTYDGNLDSFRQIVKLTDPTGMFANQFGVDMGLRWPNLSRPVPPNTDTPSCTPDDAVPPPVCGQLNSTCCASADPCDPGLACKGGLCHLDAPANTCASCDAKKTACISNCVGDDCGCSCENQYCVCQESHCGKNHCLTKLCPGL